jgi:hypothetical protein
VRSGEKVPQSGLYQSHCCGQNAVMTVEEKIPFCKVCGGSADWELIRANGEHEEAA